MNYVDVFTNLGFPVAVCVVLFSIMIFFFKKITAIMLEVLRNNEKKEEENRKYLQESNQELSKIISMNTQALNRFSYMMGVWAKDFKNKDKKE